MSLALDTNTYTALMLGHPEVTTRTRAADKVLISVIVVGELLYGFFHGSRTRENRQQLQSFLESPWVDLLPVTATTADRFGRIATALRRKGRPIPTNDIWIAAHAMETGAELLSADGHFEEIDGLVWSRFDL